MLWYYTRGMTDNDDLLRKTNTVLDMAKTTMGWDIAVVGLVGATHFTRVAAVNVPTVVIPRRESPCSHTINQEVGVCCACTPYQESTK